MSKLLLCKSAFVAGIIIGHYAIASLAFFIGAAFLAGAGVASMANEFSALEKKHANVIAIIGLSVAAAAFALDSAVIAVQEDPNADTLSLMAAAFAALISASTLKEMGLRSSVNMLIVHNTAWVGAIWSFVYFGVSIIGAVAACIAIALPLVLLWNEFILTKESEDPPSES